MVGKRSVMIVFGSGGHTSEMISLINQLPCRQYSPFFFLVANTDCNTQSKVEQENLPFRETVDWFIINRAREVKQNFFSSIITTVVCLPQSLILLLKLKPNLLLA